MPTEYVCPRCNYTTTHKPDMKRHFSRKKICSDENDLVLTDEIKQIVLENHKYHKPKPKGNDKIIINNNTLNKFVMQMDFSEKMTHVLDYEQKRLLCFEDNLENRFENRVNRLENSLYPNGYFLVKSDFYRIIDNVTKIDREHLEEFNIFYKKAVKRIQLYSGTTWESFIEEDGAHELVSLIKSYFLDNYEQYLIKHLHGDDVRQLHRGKLLEHLKIYYKFISTFELRPFISDISDKDLLGHNLIENNDHYLAEKYMELYSDEREKSKTSEKRETKKKIIDIIKENTIHNSTELNKILLEILKTDTEFRDKLITNEQE